MKAIFVCFLLALSGQAMGQQTAFVNYLLDIQYQAEALHRLMEGTFDNVRFMMANELATINARIVDEISVGLAALETIRVSTTEMVEANQIEDNRCAELATNTWFADVELSGLAVQACSASALVSLTQLTNRVHNLIEDNQHLSTELQNIVINGFADWNPITSVEALSQIIDGRVNAAYAQYNSQIVIQLEIALAEIFNQEFLIPESARMCMNEASRFLFSEGKIIQDTLELCPLE